jgi:AcrR family transcriptional regulator
LTDGHARRRPAVSEKDKLHRRDEIMVAAKKVFAHNGFHATTIADIAKEAGWPTGRSTSTSTRKKSCSTR